MGKRTRKKRRKTSLFKKSLFKKKRTKRRTRKKSRKKQCGGDKANKYWGRKDFLGKYAAPNLLPKKLKKDLWLWRTVKHGIPLPWNNKKNL